MPAPLAEGGRGVGGGRSRLVPTGDSDPRLSPRGQERRARASVRPAAREVIAGPNVVLEHLKDDAARLKLSRFVTPGKVLVITLVIVFLPTTTERGTKGKTLQH